MPYQEVMHKFKHGELHSGSKKGPKVTSRKQAIAIMMSEKRHGAKYAAHGSGSFTKAEIDKGFKVCYTSSQLKAMDTDSKLDECLASRRKPGHLRRTESSY